MTTTARNGADAARAQVSGPADTAVPALIHMLREGLDGTEPAVVLYFASASYDPVDLAGPISDAFADAVVAGCSTAGQFTDEATTIDGVSAIALPRTIVASAAGGLGDIADDPRRGTRAAIEQVETASKRLLRDRDPARTLGVVLIDGVHAVEEDVNEEIANAAPTLDVVGGSAGDDLAFARTWVALRDKISWAGVVLVACDMLVPFQIVKSCSFAPTGTTVRVTRADVASRIVHEIDGMPALAGYAAALGMAPEDVDDSVLFNHPLGLMIDGKPWLRSPQYVYEDGSIRFYAQVLEDTEFDLMAATDLVTDTDHAIRTAQRALPGSASGAVLFNCVLRRLQMEKDGSGTRFVDALGAIPTAGFHTFGESWLGHVSQTITGVLLGTPNG